MANAGPSGTSPEPSDPAYFIPRYCLCVHFPSWWMANIELCFRGRLFFLPSKREAFFVSSLRAQPPPKLTNNVLGYVLTEQFPNGSGPDQICSRRTVSFMSICSHGTGTEIVRYQSTSGPTWENQLFVPISYPPADQNAWKTIEEGWIYGLKEAKGLWPDNKLPYPCRLQNTQPKCTSF